MLCKPVEGFFGGAQVVLGLLQLPHSALPALLLLNAGLVRSVGVSGQGTSCIHLYLDQKTSGRSCPCRQLCYLAVGYSASGC